MKKKEKVSPPAQQKDEQKKEQQRFINGRCNKCGGMKDEGGGGSWSYCRCYVNADPH